MAKRWWALVPIALSMVVVGLDTTVLNVALPTLAVDLGAGTSDLQWVVDSYVLVLAALMLPIGALGDRYGRRRWLIGGLLVFGGASAVAAWAGSATDAGRGPGRHGAGRGCADHARPLDHPGPVPAGGAGPRGRRGHRRHLPRAADRPAARRLAAGQLLVGLDLPHQRAGHRARRGGAAGAGARVAGSHRTACRPGRRPAVDGRAGRPGLRRGRGAAGRLDRRPDGRRARRRRGPARGSSGWSSGRSRSRCSTCGCSGSGGSRWPPRR